MFWLKIKSQFSQNMQYNLRPNAIQSCGFQLKLQFNVQFESGDGTGLLEVYCVFVARALHPSKAPHASKAPQLQFSKYSISSKPPCASKAPQVRKPPQASKAPQARQVSHARKEPQASKALQL